MKWREMNADKSIDEVEQEVFSIVKKVCEGEELGDVGKLWM